jgi:hypothetical protein
VLPKEYLEQIKDDYNQKYYASIEHNQMFDKFKDFTLNIDKVTGLPLSEVNPLLNQYMEKQDEYT